MPELPEVETVVRGLRPMLPGERASLVWTDWPPVLDEMDPAEFNGRIAGQAIRGIHRRGKYICIAFERDFLVIHLRMTGRLYLCGAARGNDPWVHFSLAFESGRFLVFSDSRKFGRVKLCADLNWLELKLGPEPLDLEPLGLARLMTGSSRTIKVFLLDQTRVAGVGNIYADESLFKAGIHPQRTVDSLKAGERNRLAEAVQTILQQAIGHEGASISWYRKPDGSMGESQKHFCVYGRENEPCLVCGTPIRRIVLAQRSTHFCPKCQKARRT